MKPVKGKQEATKQYTHTEDGEGFMMMLEHRETGRAQWVHCVGSLARGLVPDDKPGAEAECMALRDGMVATAPRGYALFVVDPALTEHGWECSVELIPSTSPTLGVA